METVREAAKSAQADEFVTSFVHGYDTEMGQGGVNVSGGQKQRLCIARALLKKPRILILDDSTSAVDTATEAQIRKAFRTSLKDTTKFIIAQRISSVEDADKIIVLDDGKIIGMGTHNELLGSCEAYREIYETQYGRNSGDEEDGGNAPQAAAERRTDRRCWHDGSEQNREPQRRYGNRVADSPRKKHGPGRMAARGGGKPKNEQQRRR